MQEFSHKFKFRLLIISVIVYTFAFLMLGRLFFLQVVHGDVYLRKSLQNKNQFIRIPAYRSVILDRTLKTKLAYNRKSMSVILIPANLPEDPKEREQGLSNASELLDIPLDDLKSSIRKQSIDKYTHLILKFDISSKTLVKFAEHHEKYPGMYWENRPRRVYPLTEKASQLIGYTGVISKSELKRLQKYTEYHSGSILGKMGIEKYYDERIRGKEGVLERLVDAKGNVLKQTVKREAAPGNPLVLSIDADLQEMAYQLLEGRKGAVVISKPSTGEILALVSIPGFDPNLFTDRFSPEEFFILKNNQDKPFLNRAIQGTYPPSSIFKLITASAALDADWNPNIVNRCTGRTRVGNRIFKCWGVHGNENLIGAIADSCDSYFYKMGISIGRDQILKFARNYGINQPTHIDLSGERRGLIPEATWFKKRHKRPWQTGDTANISIGQGDLLATPIEINMMTASIVNEGIIYKPHLLKEVLSLDIKKTIWKNQPEVLRKINLSSQHFKLIKRGMRAVVDHGTASWIQKYLTRVPLAGKTGTGQAGGDQKDHAWFTAFAPFGYKNLDNVIAVTVVVEHGGGGSVAAAPVAAKLIDYYFKYKKPMKFPPVKH